MENEKLTSLPAHFVTIADYKMYYLEQGSGDPIVLLHSVPASSYVWRRIIPHLARIGRCIAPDFIGFGRSDKPTALLTLQDHIHYLDKFIDTLKLKNITLVMHGFGSLIGFDYAMRHEKNIKGLVFYESYINPLNEASLSLPYQEYVAELKNLNPDLLLNSPYIIDKILPQTMLNKLSQQDISYYRMPYLTSGSGKQIYQYIQDLPCGDKNNKADQCIAKYSDKLMHSKLPKLMLYSMPGFVTTIDSVIWAKKHLTQLEVVDVGEELHYAQESRPDFMGEMISAWLQAL